MLNLLPHKHSISLYLLEFQFLTAMFVAFIRHAIHIFVIFIPRHFTFNAIVNCIFIFYFDAQLFTASVYKYGWFLYVDLMSCRLVYSIGFWSTLFFFFLHRKSCHLKIKIILLLPFQYVWIFFCLIALAMTYSAMPNKNGECRHPCLAHDSNRKACSLSPCWVIDICIY